MKNCKSSLQRITPVIFLKQPAIVLSTGFIILESSVSVAKFTELDILNFKPGSRCFFMDLGVAYYYLSRTGATVSTMDGSLNENYVYINLSKRQEFPEEIIFETPAFATYKGGEIDFVAQTLKTHIRYLIEVKAGKGTASTALKALEQGKANKLLYLKGDTKGGTAGNVQTLPIYLLEQYHFSIKERILRAAHKDGSFHLYSCIFILLTAHHSLKEDIYSI
mgnify:CR=1 FL=1